MKTDLVVISELFQSKGWFWGKSGHYYVLYIFFFKLGKGGVKTIWNLSRFDKVYLFAGIPETDLTASYTQIHLYLVYNL